TKVNPFGFSPRSEDKRDVPGLGSLAIQEIVVANEIDEDGAAGQVLGQVHRSTAVDRGDSVENRQLFLQLLPQRFLPVHQFRQLILTDGGVRRDVEKETADFSANVAQLLGAL